MFCNGLSKPQSGHIIREVFFIGSFCCCAYIVAASEPRDQEIGIGGLGCQVVSRSSPVLSRTPGV